MAALTLNELNSRLAVARAAAAHSGIREEFALDHGLRVRVYPTGKAAFVYRYRTRGSSGLRILTLSPIGKRISAADLEAAEDRHRVVRRELYAGADPKAKRDQQPKPFSREGWLFEINYHGFRALAYVEDGSCTLTSRKGIDYTRFKSLAKAIPAEVDAADAILDGEIVVLDDRGHPQFHDLMHNRGKPVFAAFDLLWLDGEDLRDLPLWQRKSLLEGCLRRPHERVLYVDHVEQRGEQLFRQVCDIDLEGIVCKPADSPYGRGPWIKVKNPRYSQAVGRRELFNKGSLSSGSCGPDLDTLLRFTRAGNSHGKKIFGTHHVPSAQLVVALT